MESQVSTWPISCHHEYSMTVEAPAMATTNRIPSAATKYTRRGMKRSSFQGISRSPLLMVNHFPVVATLCVTSPLNGSVDDGGNGTAHELAPVKWRVAALRAGFVILVGPLVSVGKDGDVGGPAN